MKKDILYKTVLIALTFMVGSCADLDENPIGVLSPESFFNTENDVKGAVMGIYSNMACEEYFGRKYTCAVALLGDACDISDIGTSSRRIVLNNLDPDTSNGMISEFWPRIYKTIGAANSAIDGAESITVSDTEGVNQLKAEAMIIRAYCYYNLVRLFGGVPYIGETVSNVSSISDIPRTSEDEIYKYIIADCEYAEKTLPDKYADDIRCRPTAGSAKTMLASVYLTLGEYDKAEKYAEEVINNADKYGYSLVNDFTELWKADNGDMSEHIWTVDFQAGTSDDLWGPLTGVRGSDMNGWDAFAPSPGLYDLYSPGDYRKEATFVLETPVNGVMTPYTEWTWPRIHFGKYSLYPGAKANSDGRRSGRNYPIFRFAEVFLIAAEASTEVNGEPTDKSYEYINKIRERARFGGTEPADIAPGTMTKDEFIAAVLKERLLEFPIEYKRWFDIKRRDLGKEVFEGPNSIEPHTFNESRHYLLPLPQDELDRNHSLTQNPGY